jgi:hypothetical protein
MENVSDLSLVRADPKTDRLIVKASKFNETMGNYTHWKIRPESAGAMVFLRRSMDTKYRDLKTVIGENLADWYVVMMQRPHRTWTDDTPTPCESNKEDGRVRYDVEKKVVYMVVQSLEADHITPYSFPLDLVMMSDQFDVPTVTWSEAKEIIDRGEAEEERIATMGGRPAMESHFETVKNLNVPIPEGVDAPTHIMLIGANIDRNSGGGGATNWLLNDPATPESKGVGIIRTAEGDVVLVTSALAFHFVGGTKQMFKRSV